MNLLEKILAIYPDLSEKDFAPFVGVISLRNDMDGRGDYIERWEHPTHPKPTDEQIEELE